MSYYCKVSFKKLQPHEIQPFFTAMKRETISRLEEIAKANFTYCPLFLGAYGPVDYKDKETRKILESWAHKVFKYKFFFASEGTLLGVFGVPSCIQHLFDATIEFQNSCDQDYDFCYWNGIPEFEQISKKWMNMSNEEVIAELKRQDEYYEGEVVDTEYYRRSLCYDEVYKGYVNDFLYREDTCLHLSVFGFYNLLEIQKFCTLVVKYLNKCLEEENS